MVAVLCWPRAAALGPHGVHTGYTQRADDSGNDVWRAQGTGDGVRVNAGSDGVKGAVCQCSYGANYWVPAYSEPQLFSLAEPENNVILLRARSLACYGVSITDGIVILYINNACCVA